MSSTDVVVIGAGPNGLSLGAHLDPKGVERRVFGHRMGSWRHNMPDGMILKSEPYASDLSAPFPGFSAGDFCRSVGLDYRDRVTPISRERFIEYGEWFADKLVSDIEETEITSLAKHGRGFHLSTAAGEQISARRVVVASGIIPFAHVPRELKDLPPDLVSHSSAHTDLSRFRGCDVAVVGGGQSALETAALLNESGARPRLIVRGSYVGWPSPNPETPSRLRRLRKPVARLCEGWPCWAYTQFPDAFRSLGEQTRIERARTFLGPAGAWWLRPRVEGQVPMLLGTTVVEAAQVGSRVRLGLWGPAPITIDCDHVIAATGYRYDLARLSYLDPKLRGAIDVAGGAPKLSRGLESSVPGLFFMGALAAPSLGPSMRFVAGTHFAARRLAGRLARNLIRGRPFTTAILLAVVLVGCSSHSAPTAQTASPNGHVPTGWKIYRGTRVPFVVAYPPDWTVDESGASVGQISFTTTAKSGNAEGTISSQPVPAHRVGLPVLRQRFLDFTTRGCELGKSVQDTGDIVYSGVTFATGTAKCVPGEESPGETEQAPSYDAGVGLKGSVEWTFSFRSDADDFAASQRQLFTPMLQTINIYGK